MLARILAIIAAIAAFFGIYQKAARETEKRKGLERTREVESKAVDALTTGLANEVAALEEARRRRAIRKRDKLRDRTREP